jgi:peptidoglycan/xylan/chitin deacetylase (PgdA/CDA1 family)
VSDILQPTIIPSILAGKRHEIAAHGWIHEDLALLTGEDEERGLLEKAVDYLTKTVGKRPTGFRSPNATFSQFSIKLLKQAGFVYDSTLMSSDDAFELKVNGQPTGLVELPVDTILQDSPYFPRNGSLPSPEHVYTVYKDEFDLAYGEGRLFIIALRPHVIGHRSRAAMLDQLLTYMKSKPGVWFTTADQLAEYVRKNAEPTQ